MAYDFPASPSVGTLFAPAGGPTWQWNGTTWTAVSPAGLVPEAPTDGQNYVRRNGVWVLAPGTAEAKNRIVNPAMQITQEFVKQGGVATKSYVADQWTGDWSTTGTPSMAVQADTTSDPDVLYWLRQAANVADTSIAATEYYYVVQPVEGIRIAEFKWGTAQAKPAVLRFKANSAISGTFCVTLQNAAGTQTFVKNCAIVANTPTWFTVTVPAQTTGVWPTTNVLAAYVGIATMAGTNWQAPAEGWNSGSYLATSAQTNWLASTSNFLDFSNVGLYLDPNNTGIAPPWQMPDEAQELATCQRYWRGNPMSMGTWLSAPVFRAIAAIVPPMRTTPALAVRTSTALEDLGVQFVDISAPSMASFGGPTGAHIGLTTSAGTAGHIGCLSPDCINLNARM